MKDFDIICSIDDLCYSDFYQGHGHVFEPENLIACLPFAVWSHPDITNLDIFFESISGDYDIINEDREGQIRDIPDIDLQRAFRDELKSDLLMHDKPFENMDIGDEVYLYGYYHVYLKEPEL